VKANSEQIQNPKSKIQNRTCLACGTEAQREFAKYCLVCGKLLLEDYQPLDSLRASNRLPKTKFKTETTTEIKNLFEEENNGAASLAWAFVVYSMVPYLGILFTPGAVLMSGVGLYIAYRKPYLGGQKMAIYSFILSFVILAIQILLWWLLYIIPELSK
jgi:hypothetical protein